MNSLGFPDYSITGNGAEIPFNSGEPDVNNSFWYMDGEMAGWDSPDGRVTMLTKIGNNPNADGEYPADQHYRGRTFTFTLYASCPSEEAREASRYLLTQALDLVDGTGVLLVNEEVPKACTISRSGNTNQGKLVMTDSGFAAIGSVITPGMVLSPINDETGLMYLLKADIECYSADPRKYSTPFSGPIPIEDNAFTIDNLGNTTDTNFFILIEGGVEGSNGPLHITLVNSANPDGITMTLVVPTLPPTAPALSPFPTEIGINFYENTIRDGAGNLIYYLRDLTTPWLVLSPGENVFTFTGPDVTMIDGEATWNSAWI
jgi:hypothetical protein